MQVVKHRHPNEESYFILSAVAGGATWFALVAFTLGIGLVVALVLLGVLWVAGRIFRAQVLGNALRVGPRQHPFLHAMLVDVSTELELTEMPEVYVLSGSGLLNAFAARFFGRGSRYVLLLSELVDLYLERGKPEELKAILSHELAHHALGHTSPWKVALLAPSRIIAFLPNAYSRACEFSCDRVALAMVGDEGVVQRALLTLATGSKTLANDTREDEFLEQEKEMPGFFGFLAEILSTHPRMTRRVQAIRDYAVKLRQERLDLKQQPGVPCISRPQKPE